MKKVYLICNAHIDPVWQWDWAEGAACTISTFYSAVNLLKEYDFVFNHNEALIYEYVEKNDPELFKQIQDLVKEGKWKIIGGWYDQPDCMVPSGESFIRQISLGREYFMDKFNVKITAANNFDSFAHTRGLPSILKKCGYESYTICRPMTTHDLYSDKPLPTAPFLWKGYDGSLIKTLRFVDKNIYLSPIGSAKSAILRKIDNYKDENVIPVLWGVGNHGGGASRKDLSEIEEIKQELKDTHEIKHSTLDEYFKNTNPTEIVSRQLICLMKSFSSVSNIKQAHDNLENTLYLTEKVCSIADLNGYYHYNKNVLKKAEQTLCQIEFHDVLSGTAVKLGTDSSIRKANMAIEMLKEEFFSAFNSMVEHLPSVHPGDEGLVFLNPYPYEYKGLVNLEFYAFPEINGDIHYEFNFIDKNNNKIQYQVIKEDAEINSERRKRVLLDLSIPACGAISIGVEKKIVEGARIRYKDESSEDIIIKDDIKEVIISRSTGLISSLKVNGQELVHGAMAEPLLFNDDEDPWGWKLTRFDEKGKTIDVENPGFTSFKKIRLNNRGKTPFENLKGVTVIENGDLLTEVQALFSTNYSYIINRYKIYKNKPYIDIDTHVLWNESKKGLKLNFGINGNNKYFAQAAFGIENYAANKFEQPCNRYVGVNFKDFCLAIYNRSGIHSVSKSGKNLSLTLLNGSVYCAHPTFKGNTFIGDKARFVPYIEQGVHDFSFRLGINKIEELEKLSKEFNEPVYGLYYFPHGKDDLKTNVITIDDTNIVISALKRLNDGRFMIRLYNGTNNKVKTTLNIKGVSTSISFKKFEFNTYIFDGNKIVLAKDAAIY